MRHRKAGSKFNRNSSHRNAMYRNMVTSLMKHDRITTTDARAKALRGLADHLITLAKQGDLHARRQAMAIVTEKDVVHRLFENAQERFGAVSGGYTRIIKVGYRQGDAAMMSLLELVIPDKGAAKKITKKIKTEKKDGAAIQPSKNVAAVPLSENAGGKNSGSVATTTTDTAVSAGLSEGVETLGEAGSKNGDLEPRTLG